MTAEHLALKTLADIVFVFIRRPPVPNSEVSRNRATARARHKYPDASDPSQVRFVGKLSSPLGLLCGAEGTTICDMASKLGKLAKVDLREIWKNEEYDFSTWLAEDQNLTQLSDEVGISIRLLEKEAGVGKYSVDILAEEEGTGRKIVIENQLEKTNHDHLGKVITYAAGHGASIVIWIFKEITEEHRSAVDWLNENTGENLLFFAIRIEAWRISNSDPAPKFQVICKPNEWSKLVKHSSDGRGLGETDLKKLDFWTKLKSYALEKRVPLFRQTPAPRQWYNISIGSAEAHIGLTMNTRANLLGCEIYVSDNKPLFNFLKARREAVEQQLGAKLEWIEAKKACRAVQRKTNADIDDEAGTITLFDWLIDRAIVFEKVFSPLVKKFKEEAMA